MRYTKANLREVEDSAAKFGYGELQESRFPREQLGLETSGLAYHRVRPGQRQPFAHRHERAEEVHVVLAGSGYLKVDDERVPVAALDVIRVPPGVTRAFEAGPDGLDYVVFSPRHEGESEMVRDFWD
jgi:mannose-6-phosphate isomerase-like protein (cupin superfamily)